MGSRRIVVLASTNELEPSFFDVIQVNEALVYEEKNKKNLSANTIRNKLFILRELLEKDLKNSEDKISRNKAMPNLEETNNV